MVKADSKQALKQLHDEKERLELIISTLNTGLALISPDMTLVWSNAIIKKLYPEANFPGKKCFAVAEKRTTPCEGCQTVLAFKDGEIHEREFQNKDDKRWYKVVALPVKDQEGRVINVLEASSDIHDRKQLEISRDQALNEIKALKQKLEEENVYLKSELQNFRRISDMVGTSNVLRYVQTQVAQVAPTNATVLIQGETGVGKELVACAIHDGGNCRSVKKPFIKLNCAAIPANLVESELFGHEKGAFTSAAQQRKGRFELADKGTLFLDEISELPLETQVKLLRVLQDGKFERVGGDRPQKSKVRIIAATNKDLLNEVKNGRFRADLYYRINVYPITVPPLRKRLEDIPALVEHFISQIGSDMGKKIDKIPQKVMEQFKAYDWPGNIRELRNVIERSLITSPGSTFQLADDLVKIHKSYFPPAKQMVSLDEIQHQHIEYILTETEWKINGPDGAAEILQLEPSTLRHRMKKLGIKR
jgi:formate hydrogenlyase transcriptional activator